MAKPMTSAEKVTQKVEWTIETGEIPDIESSYERDRVVKQLGDYVNHPDTSARVVERAETATKQICSE